MSNQAACPACGVQLQLPDDEPGRAIQCVRCGLGLVTGTGGQLLTQQQPSPSANPFADGQQAGCYEPGATPPGSYPRPPLSRDKALALVRGPAVMLQILGWLLVVAAMPCAALHFVVDHEQHPITALMTFGVAPVALVCGGFTIFCGSRMKALRSYRLVMALVIVCLVLGLIIFFPIGFLPFVWPLVVLTNSGVRDHFGAQAAAQMR